MSKKYKTKSKKKITLQKILSYIVLVLVVIIALGTIIGLTGNKQENKELTQKKDPAAIRGDKGMYSDLGRLRALSGDTPPCPIVIFPVLEYNSKDKDFEEELVQKKEEIRQIILAFFLNYKSYELYSMSEVEIKKALINGINSILSLSKIEKIYFKEFDVLE